MPVAFDLARVRKELEAAPLASPYPPELAAAIVSDTFRLGGVVPPEASAWKAWRIKRRPYYEEQLGMLAHALAATALREQSVAALLEKPVEPAAALPAFFDAVIPLTAEMIRSNTFRQEEFLRRFIETLGAGVAGETARQSAARLRQLDYRQTLAEFNKAEASRKQEAARRAKLLQEARDKEAAARGWRE
jgi:hypothetical protein